MTKDLVSKFNCTTPWMLDFARNKSPPTKYLLANLLFLKKIFCHQESVRWERVHHLWSWSEHWSSLLLHGPSLCILRHVCGPLQGGHLGDTHTGILMLFRWWVSWPTSSTRVRTSWRPGSAWSSPGMWTLLRKLSGNHCSPQAGLQNAYLS